MSHPYCPSPRPPSQGKGKNLAKSGISAAIAALTPDFAATFFLLVSVSLLFVFAFFIKSDTALAEQTSGPARQADSGLELKCQLEPETWANAGFANPGRIERLLIENGDAVQAGQRLAELSNPQQHQAAIAAAELQVVLAQQALDRLDERSDHELALAEQALAQANKAVETAGWQAAAAKRPFSQQSIAQAYANQLLAKKQRDQLRKDLEKLEKLVSDTGSFIWNFIRRSQFKQQILFMKNELANMEGRYQDAVQKYEDRLKPPDPIDVALAEANLAAAQAAADKARLDRDRLAAGPDADELARLKAEQQVAQGRLETAISTQAASFLAAPIGGQVAEVRLKAGEWAPAGQSVLVIADLSHWRVQCEELTEEEIVALQEGQTVRVRVDALPELDLAGTVSQVGLAYREVRDEARFQAEIALDEAPATLRWGMTVRVTIPASTP
jgi:multidrug resistance efflux pump